MEKFSATKEVRVIAMMRSGHHAIINWILNQAEGNVLFTNENRIKLNWSPDLYLWNSEDAEAKSDYETILVLRDPYNVFASRMKRCSHFTHPYSEVGWYSQGAIDLWKKHARAYLDNKFININYNSWTQDSEYRLQICQQLSIPFTDEGFFEVPDFGYGSSFENGNVLERYKYFTEMPLTKSFGKMKVNERFLIGENEFQKINDTTYAAVTDSNKGDNYKYGCGLVNNPDENFYTLKRKYCSLFDKEMIDLTESIFGFKINLGGFL